jgi:5-formyltetrahydrofolate cyclo-ligase
VTIPNSTHKKQLRTAIRSLLRDAPAGSASVCDEVRKWLAERPGLRTVALYAALPEEVDLLPLLAWDPGRCWVFPRVSGPVLEFHQVRNPALDFVIAPPLGLREPAFNLPLVPVTAVDVFLCPGLAFDARGGRLGRGRGYYDQTLAMARPDALKVGVCHRFQYVPEVFSEPHDMPMDLVIAGAPAGGHCQPPE